MDTTPGTRVGAAPARQLISYASGTLRDRSRLRLLLPALGLIMLLALLNYGAFARTIWTDEAYSISYTFHPGLGQLLADVRSNEETPPSYFVLLWAWAQAFGHGELAMRSLSLLAGLVATQAFAVIAWRLLPPAEALVAVGTFASAPLLHGYLAEARGYTLTVLLATLCVAAFERLLRRRDCPRAQALYAASAIALFLTSYFSVALLAAHGCILLWGLREPAGRPQRLRSIALMLLASAAAVSWWLPSLVYQVHIAPYVTTDWSQGPLDYYRLILGPILGPPQVGWRYVVWHAAAWGSLFLMGAAFLAPNRELRDLAVRALLIPALMLLLMVFVMKVVVARYLIVLLPGAAIAVGVGLRTMVGLRRNVAATFATLLYGGVLALALSAPAAPPKNAWAEISAIVAAGADPAGDALVLQPPTNQRVIEYYYRGPTVRLLGAHHYDEFYYHGGLPFAGSWSTAQLLPRLEGSRRVWLLYDHAFKVGPGIELPYREVGRWREQELELILYEVPAP